MMSQTQVLIIGSDLRHSARVAKELTGSGYSARILQAGAEGIARASSEIWSAIILVNNLPEMHDFELLKTCVSIKIPVLVWTTIYNEKDEIAALLQGASDYLTKQSSTGVLLARLHASIHRKTRMVAENTGKVYRGQITVADLNISVETRRATLGGRPLTLTVGEFSILLSLAQTVGHVKTRDQLSTEIYSREHAEFDRVLDMQISTLRKKLGDDPKNPRFIHTVRSQGYVLLDPDFASN